MFSSAVQRSRSQATDEKLVDVEVDVFHPGNPPNAFPLEPPIRLPGH